MLRVSVAAHPAARQERVELLADDSLAVYVRSRPVEGQANAAIEAAIAKALGLRKRSVRIVSGLRGRRKIVELDVADLAALREHFVAHGLLSS